MKPIMNIISEKMIHATVKNMPQSMLISGPEGVGLGTIAKYIGDLLKVKPIIILPEKEEKIDIESGVISVDMIRRLYDEVRTKSSGKRLIVIDFAERMTKQAQNSFLKLLEEPGKNIHFILVSHSSTILIPTVLSRMEKLEIKPISVKQSKKILEDLKLTDKVKQSQILFMASGLPAELTRLSTDEEYFEKRSVIVKDARELLRGSLYQKLLIAHDYKDNRDSALKLLADVMTILQKSINDNPHISTISRIDSVLEAYQKIQANGNIRLCLTRMVI